MRVRTIIKKKKEKKELTEIIRPKPDRSRIIFLLKSGPNLISINVGWNKTEFFVEINQLQDHHTESFDSFLFLLTGQNRTIG